MLSSIHPLGEWSKHNRYTRTAAAFVIGSLLGGIALGTVGSLAGQALGALVDRSARWAPAVLVASAAVAAATELLGTPLPRVRRQVNEEWLHRYRGWVYGAGFGLQLGSGVSTHITTGAVHVLVVATVLAEEPLAAVALGGLFGLGRGLTVLATRSVTTPDALVALHERVAATAAPVRRAAAAALAAAAMLGGAVAWGGV